MRTTFWLPPLMAAAVLATTPGQRAEAAGASPSSSAKVQVDAAKLGAPIYPGAVFDNDYGPNKCTSKNGQTEAHFITHDAFAKVYACYKARMPKATVGPCTATMSVAKFEIGQMSDPDYIAVGLLVEMDQDGKPDGTQVDMVHFLDKP